MTLEDYLNTLRREFRASLDASLRRLQDDRRAERRDSDTGAVAFDRRWDGSTND